MVDPQIISGSTNGDPVAIVATATPGTVLHTATSAAGELDDVTMYAANTTAADIALTVEVGAGNLVQGLVVPANSALVPICSGLRVKGGLILAAFAASAGIVVVGKVNRISPDD